jgi:hypothetical protein
MSPLWEWAYFRSISLDMLVSNIEIAKAHEKIGQFAVKMGPNALKSP